MDNVDGENFDLDALKGIVEEAAPEEPTAEPIEGQPVEAEQAELREASEEGFQEETEKGPSKLPVYLEWAGVIAIPVIILALAWFGVWYFSTAFYVISVGLIPYGIWKGRETNTVYTVILGCTLVAVLTAVYCLWLEIGRYNLEVKAKQQVDISQPIQAGFLAEKRREAANG